MSPGTDANALLALGGLEVVGGDVLSRLEPRDPAQPRHVEQHAAPDEAVPQDVDRPRLGALRGHGLLGHRVVEEAVVGDMGEGVDVAVTFVVVVDPDVVLREAHAPGSDVLVGQHGHVVIRRLGIVDAVLGVERQAEGDRDATAHESRGRDHALWA